MISRELQPLINRLSNWQRNQWARAGYPESKAALKDFSRLQKNRTKLYFGDILPKEAA